MQVLFWSQAHLFQASAYLRSTLLPKFVDDNNADFKVLDIDFLRRATSKSQTSRTIRPMQKITPSENFKNYMTLSNLQ